MEINIIEIIVCMCFLIICCLTDLKSRIIYRNICIIFGIVCILLKIFLNNEIIKTVLIGIVPGVILYFISIITRESIGKGDAWIFGVLGMYIGALYSTVLLMISLIIVSIFSMPLIIKQKNLKAELPFSPFILLAFTILIII